MSLKSTQPVPWFAETIARREDLTLKQLIDAYRTSFDVSKPRRGDLVGSWGSSARLLAALLGAHFDRPVFFLTAHIPDADEAQDDLETFIGCKVELLPPIETHDSRAEPTSEIACERLRLCQKLRGSQGSRVVLAASVQAVMQPVPAESFFEKQTLVLSCADRKSLLRTPDEVAAWLADHHFERVDQVDAVGDFAMRGGIVDIFSPGLNHPVRLEFFGDEIESIRYFDLDTQRSVERLDTVSILACGSPQADRQQTIVVNHLAADTLIVIEDPLEITEVGRLFLERSGDARGLYTVESVFRHLEKFDQLRVNRFAGDLGPHSFRLNVQSVQRFENQLLAGIEALLAAAGEQTIFLYCENEAEKQRVCEIIQSGPPCDTAERHPLPATQRNPVRAIPAGLHLPIGLVHHGFSLPDLNAVVVGHHEIFGQQHRRRIRRTLSTQAIDSFTDLTVNDLVVHVVHGIGRYLGMKTLEKNGRQEEFLTIEYANKALLHVPANKIDLVHKYVGALTHKPALSHLGTTAWQKQKEKAQGAIEDLAAELIEIQAHRELKPGISYPDDTLWQKEFEQAFIYQETEDQTSTCLEIKKDMIRSRPMDRLLCGDVGYGKTELAMRAAFKAVEFGKQVAVLVPTTVLAEQHYRTFTQRMANFPFNIACLSRFKTGKQAKDILKKTSMGFVDILIGTHRLLSKDVQFADLGLVVIDEEQRFGVEHKEHLKSMRKTVDVLTMTATPIPRTLHLALLGLRDISSLTTPPLDRRSIVTEVCSFDRRRLRDIILREMAREGQVYFVHNRVQDIETFANTVEQLVPEARVIFAHGQMSKVQLESRMLQFVKYQADVFVTTTIIESGLDIPNANTILIDEADRFGLAELHQLRGRVGREKHRAYAYMLLPQKRPVNPTAAKRLKAIEEYSQLGSGFRIAMRDLEIRGAGNILGMEQSGHIEAVGYELYCRLLAAAVRRLKGQPEPVAVTTHLEFNLSVHIPRSYIASERQRLEVYRRLTTCQSIQDVRKLEEDLKDLFGKIPQSVGDLLQQTEIRILASHWPISRIMEKKPDLIFTLSSPRGAEKLFARAPGSVRVPDPQTVHLRLPENYFDSYSTLFAVLRRFLGTA